VLEPFEASFRRRFEIVSTFFRASFSCRRFSCRSSTASRCFSARAWLTRPVYAAIS